MPPGMLIVRKLADKSAEALAAHPPDSPDKYPLLGVVTCDARGRAVDPPQAVRVNCGWVDKAVQEGWLELVNERHVARPGGPPGNKWRRDKIHNFIHCDEMVIKTPGGDEDVRYKVVHQPDKYVDETDFSDLGPYEVGTEPPAHPTAAEDAVEVTDERYAAGHTRVDWFYDLELVEG